jgi:hypothetical protein
MTSAITRQAGKRRRNASRIDAGRSKARATLDASCVAARVECVVGVDGRAGERRPRSRSGRLAADLAAAISRQPRVPGYTSTGNWVML